LLGFWPTVQANTSTGMCGENCRLSMAANMSSSGGREGREREGEGGHEREVEGGRVMGRRGREAAAAQLFDGKGPRSDKGAQSVHRHTQIAALCGRGRQQAGPRTRAVVADAQHKVGRVAGGGCVMQDALHDAPLAHALQNDTARGQR
jgi:hypothetical protein